MFLSCDHTLPNGRGQPRPLCGRLLFFMRAAQFTMCGCGLCGAPPIHPMGVVCCNEKSVRSNVGDVPAKFRRVSHSFAKKGKKGKKCKVGHTRHMHAYGPDADKAHLTTMRRRPSGLFPCQTIFCRSFCWVVAGPVPCAVSCGRPHGLAGPAERSVIKQVPCAKRVAGWLPTDGGRTPVRACT